jgi:hypothetical protein
MRFNQDTGLSKTHGAPNGVKMDTLELRLLLVWVSVVSNLTPLTQPLLQKKNDSTIQLYLLVFNNK